MSERKPSRVTIDRRQYERLPITLPVMLRYEGREISATALNLSCGGMLLDAADAELLPNTHLEVILDLSGRGRHVELEGEVIRCESLNQQSRVGVRFKNLFALGTEALQHYLAHKKRRTY
jgi:c-di-GMP-binding flagellar brake protein YcgR